MKLSVGGQVSGMRQARDRDVLIELNAGPPSVVKYGPTYQRSNWGPWNQGLKGDSRGSGGGIDVLERLIIFRVLFRVALCIWA